MSDRQQLTPCDPEAEWGAIGHVVENEGLGVESLECSLFSLEEPARLVEALAAMTAAKVPITPETLARQFGEGGVQAVAKAMEATGPGIAYWLPVLREKRGLRYVREVASKLGVGALQLNCNPAAVAPEIRALCSDASARLTSISAGLETRPKLRMKDHVEAMMRTQRAADEGTLPPKIPTGIPSLDSALGGGLRSREVAIIAARTSVGKSAFAGYIAAQACRAGFSTLYASREMSTELLLNRFLCLESGVSFRAEAGTRGLSGRDGAAIASATGRVCRWPLEIKDDIRTISDVRAAVLETRPKLVVVDHAGIFHADGLRKGATSTEAASFVSHQIRDLAFELDVAVLCLVQINRAGAEEPSIANLKDSGSFEEDARAVIILHRAEERPGGVNVLDLSLAKNTSGPLTKLSVEFHAPTFNFRQIVQE